METDTLHNTNLADNKHMYVQLYTAMSFNTKVLNN